MKIEHLAIWVKDLEKSRDFYCRYFNGKSNNMYHNERKGFRSYFIKFDEGSRIELMTVANLKESGMDEFVFGLTHMAFSVGSKEKVIELTETLRSDGYKVVSEPRTTGDGYFESCVLDCDGNKVEITI